MSDHSTFTYYKPSWSWGI